MIILFYFNPHFLYFSASKNQKLAKIASKKSGSEATKKKLTKEGEKLTIRRQAQKTIQ
jgi:hypothetical protein